MPSTYSPNLSLELIGTGDQAGTWGNTTNTNLGTLIEQAISGYVTQAVATGTDTTITIPNGATGVARNMYIELTGTGGTNTNLIVPSNKKLYFIFNNSTGAVTVKVSGQTGVSVPQGKKVVLASNGTDVVNGLNYIADFGSNSATITQLSATSATITNLTLTSLVLSNLSIASANITTLSSGSANITQLNSTSATITTLTGTSAGITTLSSGSANITQLNSTSATITTLTGTSANITTLSGTTATFASGTITNLSSTSLTLSNNPVLNGGTANGVLYLNASKVATSGSALVFDGTNFGVGTSDVYGTINVQRRSAAPNNTISLGDFVTASNSVGIYGRVVDPGLFSISSAGAPIRFSLDGGTTEGMRLDSTGLGIGTSSPDNKLEVTVGDNGGINIEQTGAGQTGYLNFRDSDGALEGRISYDHSNNSLRFVTSQTEKVRITSAGNVGIGTSSPAQKLDVRGSSPVVSTRATDASGTATLQLIGLSATTNDGGVVNLVAGNEADNPSSYLAFQTRNSAGTIAEKMRLDSSGNLGLGVTPSAWETSEYKAIQVGIGGSFYGRVQSGDQDKVGMSGNAFFDQTDDRWEYIATDSASRYDQGSGGHFWFTAPSGTAGNAISFTQAMTLNASGQLLVGTTTAVNDANIQIQLNSASNSGKYIGFNRENDYGLIIGYNNATGLDYGDIRVVANKPLTFSTNNTERARIPAAGGMVVGTAALATNATDGFLYVPTCAGTPTGTPTTQTGTAPIVIDTTNNKLYFYSGGQWRDAGP